MLERMFMPSFSLLSFDGVQASLHGNQPLMYMPTGWQGAVSWITLQLFQISPGPSKNEK